MRIAQLYSILKKLQNNGLVIASSSRSALFFSSDFREGPRVSG
jgi:hypothetical protein